jgi:hypothetical protein
MIATMKKLALLAFVLAANPAAAASMTTNGPSALALAAIVASHSRTLGAADRNVLARLFGGRTDFGRPRKRKSTVSTDKITVSAESIDCKVSNIDITERSCAVAFASSNREIKGREAHELYATLVEAGVASDGAAGTIHETISHLLCTIDPNAIKQKDGSGAQCKFDTGG